MTRSRNTIPSLSRGSGEPEHRVEPTGVTKTKSSARSGPEIAGLPTSLFDRHRRDYPEHDSRTALRLNGLLARWFAPAGLTPPKFNLLVTLWARGDEPLPLSEISRYLLTTPTNVTGLADRLEDEGYVVRRAHPTDRRSILVALTAKGHEILRSVMPVYLGRIDRAMSSLTHKERETLAVLLAKFDRAFEALEDE
jgi:DNA-binding MarR family transcriptional regulator